MLFSSWWKRMPGTSRPRSRTTRRPERPHVPRLEALEDRLAPANNPAAILPFANAANNGFLNDGYVAYNGPAVDATGNLYETVQSRAGNGADSIIEVVKATNKSMTLATFPANPASDGQLIVNTGLVMDAAGNLYGTTENGGDNFDGSVFELAAGSRSIQTLASFSFTDAISFPGALILAGNKLYGTTFQGGADNDGTVFSLTTSGESFQTLAQFNFTDGDGPECLFLAGGTLFGATFVGGLYTDGTVFSLPAGGGPIDDVVDLQGGDTTVTSLVETNDVLYGTFINTGAQGRGSVFSVPLFGTPQINTLFNFGDPGIQGDTPVALTLDGPDIIGTTLSGGDSHYGTVFEVNPLGGYMKLGDFQPSGSNSPFGGLSVGLDGNIYGTALADGSSVNDTLFAVTGLTIPRLTFSPQPAGGDIGTTLPAVKVHLSNAPAGSTVTLTLAADPTGANLSGTLTRPVVNGVATFSNLSIDQPGTGYTLLATSGLLQVYSNSFTVGPTLVVASQPPDEVMPDQPFGLTIKALSPNGTVDTQFNGAVTLALAGGALGGTDTVTAIKGVASFNDVTLDDPGDSDELQASAASLDATTTSAINVVDQITLTWTGKGNGKWSDPKDWENDDGDPEAPSDQGEDLVFPADAARLVTVNDIPGVAVNNVEIDAGYTINGLAFDAQSFDVTGGDSVVAEVDAEVPEASASAGIRAADSSPSPQVMLNVAAGQFDVKVLEGSESVVKTGPGPATISRLSTYTGTTILQAGQLNLLGDLPEKAELDINVPTGSTATLSTEAALNLKDTVKLQGGNLNVIGQGFTLSGPVTVSAPTTINPAAGVTLHLASTLTSDDGNGGNPALTIGGEGTVELDPKFNGNGVLIVNGGTLKAAGVAESQNGQGGSSLYSGSVTLNAGTLEVGGVPGESGSLGNKAQLMVQVATGSTATIKTDASASLLNTLTFNGGTVNLAGGHLYLDGNITVAANTILNGTAATSLVDFGTEAMGDANLNIGGPGTLTIQGTAKMTVFDYLTTNANITVGQSGADKPCELLMAGFGSGTIVVNGGELIASLAPEYTGNVQLQSGGIGVGGQNVMAKASVTVQPSSGAVYIESYGAEELGIGTLAAAVSLQGELDALSSIIISGAITVNAAGAEIDPVKGAVIALQGVGAASGSTTPPMLTLAGKGTVALAGDLSVNTTITGAVNLATTFSGSGSLTLNNGAALVSKGVGNYAGTVTVNDGTLLLGGTNPLGIGALTLGSATQPGSVQLLGANGSLGNTSITVAGGNVDVAGTLTFNSPGFLSPVSISGGTLTTNPGSKLIFGAPVSFDGGNEDQSDGQFVFQQTVTIQTGTLTLGGNNIFNGQLVLDQSTTLTLAPLANVSIPGGLFAGQSTPMPSLQVNPSPGRKVKLLLHSDIHTCSLVAGPGTTIVEQSGFPQSESAQVSAANGGTVIPLA